MLSHPHERKRKACASLRLPIRRHLRQLCGQGGAEGHTRDELDDVLGWFTQLGPEEIHAAAESGKTLQDFFEDLSLTPNADLIAGKVCGVRVEEVEDDLMRRIRMMDLLVDELARGKKIENIKRG